MLIRIRIFNPTLDIKWPGDYENSIVGCDAVQSSRNDNL